jgi:hypothetical protein
VRFCAFSPKHEAHDNQCSRAAAHSDEISTAFNSRRLHQIEFRSASDVARCAATVVLANGIQCFLKETIKV